MNSPFKLDPKRPVPKGVDTGDPFYHTTKITQVIKDDSISLKVVDDKTSIRETVDSFKDKAGLKNILALYCRTGDSSLFEARSCLNGIDATNIPTQSPESIAKELPKELTEGKSLEDIQKLTIKELVDFYSKQKSSEEVNEDVK